MGTGLRACNPLRNRCFPLNIDMRRRAEPYAQHLEVGNYVKGIPRRDVVRDPEHDDLLDVHRTFSTNGGYVALLGLETQAGIHFGGLKDVEVLEEVPDIEDDCSNIIRTRSGDAIAEKVDASGKVV